LPCPGSRSQAPPPPAKPAANVDDEDTVHEDEDSIDKVVVDEKDTDSETQEDQEEIPASRDREDKEHVDTEEDESEWEGETGSKRMNSEKKTRAQLTAERKAKRELEDAQRSAARKVSWMDNSQESMHWHAIVDE
jgi:hypothetical protein